MLPTEEAGTLGAPGLTPEGPAIFLDLLIIWDILSSNSDDFLFLVLRPGFSYLFARREESG